MEKLIAKRTAIAYDTRSEDYSQKVEYLAQACWFDVFPFFLTIWSQNFSESLHWGNWSVERHKYPYLAVEMMISGSLEYRQAGLSINWRMSRNTMCISCIIIGF